MTRTVPHLTHGILFALAVLLLITGLVVDRSIVASRQQEIRSLTGERKQLLASTSRAVKQDMTRQELTEILSVPDLAELASEPLPADPVVFLGQMLDRSELTRLELTTRTSGPVGLLHRTEFSVRVLGSFAALLEFLRSLEEAGRLITVDDLSLKRIFGHEDVEGRLNLSIYDPRREG
jgi:hypothetical protein